MLTRAITIRRCCKWFVAAPSFHHSPSLGLLPVPPFRFFSSEGDSPGSPTSHKRRRKKVVRTLAERITYCLRRVTAKRSNCVSPEPSEKEAICEALGILGFEMHIQKFVGNRATFIFIRKLQLLTAEGVFLSDVKILLRSRAFLAVSLDRFTAVHSLLKRFFLTGVIASNVLAHNFRILLEPVEHLDRKLQCLEGFEIGKDASLRVGTSARILTIDAGCLERRLAFFSKVGFSTKALDRLLCKYPQVLKFSVENNLQKVDFFERQGMNKVAVLKMFCRYPKLFGVSIENNLAMKVDTLNQLGLTCLQCCSAFGPLAKCSFQSMLTCYNALRSHFSADNVCLMIQRYPAILSQSVKSMNKKLDHVINVENRGLQEVVEFPAVFSFSLEERILPRFNILKEKGLARKYRLISYLSIKAEKFNKRFPQ